MPRACSNDLRERVVMAVEGGASCRSAALRFGVAPSLRSSGWRGIESGVMSRRARSAGGCARRFMDIACGCWTKWRRIRA